MNYDFLCYLYCDIISTSILKISVTNKVLSSVASFAEAYIALFSGLLPEL